MILRPKETVVTTVQDLFHKRKIQRMLKRTFAIQKKGLGVTTISDVNDWIENDRFEELIAYGEKAYTDQLNDILKMVKARARNIRLITIAGPSSSGKTTFSFRLADILRENGIASRTLSLDNYFLDRDDTPKDEKGEYDFESLEALDLRRLNRDLTDLIEGREVEIPEFNFKTGSRRKHGKRIRLTRHELIIMEGIHGLNKRLTAGIPEQKKFRIYVTAMVRLRDYTGHFIHSSAHRHIRRIVRDSQFRGYDAEETIRRWPSVTRGEKKNIFPFQDRADYVFNSALIYELPVLKNFAFDLLVEINRRKGIFLEARKLLSLLNYFDFIQPESIQKIPARSTLREFIGNSGYKY
jgi:uridine kinase